MAEQKGTQQDAARLRQLAAQRVENREKFSSQLAALEDKAAATSAANIPLAQRFAPGGSTGGGSGHKGAATGGDTGVRPTAAALAAQAEAADAAAAKASLASSAAAAASSSSSSSSSSSASAAAAAAAAEAAAKAASIEVRGGLETLEEYRKRKFASLGKDAAAGGAVAAAAGGEDGGSAATAQPPPLFRGALAVRGTGAAPGDGGKEGDDGEAGKEEAAAAAAAQARVAQQAKRRRLVAQRSRLSFRRGGDDDDDDDDDDGDDGGGNGVPTRSGAPGRRRVGGGAASASSGSAAAASPSLPTIMKNPDVETAFLPDRERDARLAAEAARAAAVAQAEADALKQEVITIPYSYFDGADHHHTRQMRKGHTIAQLLMLVHEDANRQLRNVPASELLVVWEDLVLPHNLSFFDLEQSGATRTKVSSPRAKVAVGEPLFAFSAADRRQNQIITVVQKTWFERNRFSAPACFWETFDPARKGNNYDV